MEPATIPLAALAPVAEKFENYFTEPTTSGPPSGPAEPRLVAATRFPCCSMLTGRGTGSQSSDVVKQVEMTRLHRFYGQECQAIVRCSACGRPHTIAGVLAPGRLSGDVTVDGHTYPIADLLAVIPQAPVTVARSPFHGLLLYAGLAWAALVCLQRLADR